MEEGALLWPLRAGGGFRERKRPWLPQKALVCGPPPPCSALGHLRVGPQAVSRHHGGPTVAPSPAPKQFASGTRHVRHIRAWENVSTCVQSVHDSVAEACSGGTPMPRAGPDTGVPFAPAQGLGTEDTRVRLRCCRLNATLWAAFPQQESTAALSPLGASARQPHPEARGYSPQGRGRCFVSVSCALYFPCVACTHPFVRELRLRVLIQARASRGTPAAPWGTAPDPEWCSSAICCWTRVLRREEGGGFLGDRGLVSCARLRGPTRHLAAHAPNSAPHAARGKPGVVWAWERGTSVYGSLLFGYQESCWPMTTTDGWDTVPDPLWKETEPRQESQELDTLGVGVLALSLVSCGPWKGCLSCRRLSLPYVNRKTGVDHLSLVI